MQTEVVVIVREQDILLGYIGPRKDVLSVARADALHERIVPCEHQVAAGFQVLGDLQDGLVQIHRPADAVDREYEIKISLRHSRIEFHGQREQPGVCPGVSHQAPGAPDLLSGDVEPPHFRGAPLFHPDKRFPSAAPKFQHVLSPHIAKQAERFLRRREKAVVGERSRLEILLRDARPPVRVVLQLPRGILRQQMIRLIDEE